jgi:hypothetical protein
MSDFYRQGISRFHILHRVDNDSLLMFGKLYLEFGDGYCFTVLNPDDDLVDIIKPVVFYSDNLLRRFKNQCEKLFWMDVDVNRKKVRFRKKRI